MTPPLLGLSQQQCNPDRFSQYDCPNPDASRRVGGGMPGTLMFRICISSCASNYESACVSATLAGKEACIFMRRLLTVLLATAWGIMVTYISLHLTFTAVVESDKKWKEASTVTTTTTTTSPAPTTTLRLSTSKDFVFLHEPHLLRKWFEEDHPCVKEHAVEWRMVVFVKSTIHFFNRRELFRRTWLSFSYVDGLAIRPVFVLGSLTSRTRNAKLIDEEARRYGDILQFNGPDNYRNIALKSLAGMSWAADNLPEDVFVSSADDDVMVNLVAMTAALRYLVDRAKKQSWPEFPIACMYKAWAGATPERHNTSKYYISPEEYRWAKWPKFCLGGMYTTSGRVSRQLWDLSRQHDPLRMDDVWITGVLREKLGMPVDMVVQPDGPVATHTKGYRGQTSHNIRGFMWKEWKELKENLVNATLCRFDGK